jgi:hypothetical protein
MHAGSSDRANRHLASSLADVIASRLVTILAASLILVPALVGQAQVQPTAGPVGSPEGVWREQIHWIPMVDAAGSQHLLQARTAGHRVTCRRGSWSWRMAHSQTI